MEWVFPGDGASPGCGGAIREYDMVALIIDKIVSHFKIKASLITKLVIPGW
jgi:hypothetical protein